MLLSCNFICFVKSIESNGWQLKRMKVLVSNYIFKYSTSQDRNQVEDFGLASTKREYKRELINCSWFLELYSAPSWDALLEELCAFSILTLYILVWGNPLISKGILQQYFFMTESSVVISKKKMKRKKISAFY